MDRQTSGVGWRSLRQAVILPCQTLWLSALAHITPEILTASVDMRAIARARLDQAANWQPTLT